MEKWQITHIDNNLPVLYKQTTLTNSIRADLLTHKILPEDDIKELDGETNERKKSYKLYDLLKTRRNAYNILTKALLNDEQSGAAHLLIEGLVKQRIIKPLTHLGISMNLNSFGDLNIKVYENVPEIQSFFPFDKHTISKLQKIFRDEIPELEYYETFVKKQRTFVLMDSTVPPEPPFYIPRYVSNQIQLDDSIFKQDNCRDVFVFKKTIDWYKVSKFGPTSESSTQLDRITSKLIILDENGDWFDLKEKAPVPIHLINYEKNEDRFFLEDTSAPADILGKLGSQNERLYKTDRDFFQQQLSNHSDTSNVCICDKPGMGKTYLLRNLASYMTENSKRSIIVYIPMIKLCTDYYLSTLLTDPENPILLVALFKYASKENAFLLFKLVEAELLRVYIFIDGYDEMHSVRVDWKELIGKMLIKINTKFPSVRFFITSKLHMREELEEILHTISYKILPFDYPMQVKFLVKLWSINNQSCAKDLLTNHATKCLEATSRSFYSSDKYIFEIPRLCKVIAENFAGKVRERENYKFSSNSFNILKIFIGNSIKKYCNGKTSKITQDQREADIKLVHTCHALKKIFPTKGFHKDDAFKAVDAIMASDEVLRIGILHQHQYTKALNAPFEFIHDTMAAFLVGEYFSTRLNNYKIFNTFIECVLDASDKKRLSHSKTVASFCDFALAYHSEGIKEQAVHFCTTISSKQLFTLLRSCCQQNLQNTFSALKEALNDLNTAKIREYLTPTNINELLLACAHWKASQIFYFCVQLLTKLDVVQIASSEKQDTLLQFAVKALNYEAVAYLLNIVSLKHQNILEICIRNSCNNDQEIRNREQILKLILNKDPSLTNEAFRIKGLSQIHQNLKKILVKFEPKLTECIQNRNAGSEVGTTNAKFKKKTTKSSTSKITKPFHQAKMSNVKTSLHSKAPQKRRNGSSSRSPRPRSPHTRSLRSRSRSPNRVKVQSNSSSSRRRSPHTRSFRSRSHSPEKVKAQSSYSPSRRRSHPTHSSRSRYDSPQNIKAQFSSRPLRRRSHQTCSARSRSTSSHRKRIWHNSKSRNRTDHRSRSSRSRFR